MKIFDRIFELSRQPASAHQIDTTISNIVFDWFNDNRQNIKDFEENYFHPILELLKATHQYIEKHFEEKEDEATHLYFDALAIQYLALKSPDNRFLKSLYDLFLSNKGQRHHYDVKDLVFRSLNLRPDKDSLHGRILLHLTTGKSIVKAFHAIHIRKDHNIADISSLSSLICNLKFDKDETAFNSLFNYIVNQEFNEKPYVLYELYRRKNYLVDTLTMLSESPHQEKIKAAFQESIKIYNTGHPLSLDFFILDELATCLDYIYSEKYKQTDDKKRPYFKVKDFEEFKSFVASATDREALVFQNVIWYAGQLWLYEQVRLFEDLLLQLASAKQFDKNWILQLLQQQHTFIHDFFLEIIYPALLKKHITELQFGDTLVKEFENLVFGRPWGNKDNEPFKTGTDILRQVYSGIEVIQQRELFLQRLNPYMIRYVHDRDYALVLDESDKKYPVLKALIDDLCIILPVALKNVARRIPMVYEEGERNFFAINFKGKDIQLTTSFIQEINNILLEEQTGYQLVTIPLMKKDYREEESYLASLAYMSAGEFDYFKDHYLKKFPTLTNSPIYHHLRYNNKEAVSFLQLKNKLGASAPKADNELLFLDDPNWAWFKGKYIDQLNSKEQWYGIMNNILQAPTGKKPSDKWLETVRSQITQLGKEKYFKELQVLMSDSFKEEFWYFDTYRDALKALIWTCTHVAITEQSLAIVKNIIENAYTKVPGAGPKSTAVGNIALDALVSTGKEEAFGLLNIMRNKTRYNRFAVILEKSIDKFKEGSDTPEQLLADRSIPTFGMANGSKSIEVEDYTLKIVFEGAALKKYWITPEGKQLKSVPGEVQEKYPVLLKEVTEEVKQINAVYTDLGKRIRTYWLYNREWQALHWQAYILEHPLINPHIQHLVWTNKSAQKDFIVSGYELKTIDGQAYQPSPGDSIILWHPVLNTEKTINAWQEYAWSHKLVQGERQIFREHYPFSTTELAARSTERFAHHFLEVKKLMAIANNAGWIFTYEHEGGNWPRIYIKPLDITAHLHCDYDRYDFALPTKDLYFTRGNTTRINDIKTKIERIDLTEIPLVSLSELCRDIDLFIATTSVSNNPELSSNRQEMDRYRMDYEAGLFSDNASARIRKRIIDKLIPVLKINSPGFEGNYLLVNGTLNKYRINLGSGFCQIRDSQKHINILPSPDQVKKSKNTRLPIEDDETLYIILAKALFLQNDAAIEDEKIVSLLKG